MHNFDENVLESFYPQQSPIHGNSKGKTHELVVIDATIVATFVCLWSVYFLAPKISDEGSGIPRSGLPKLFTYLYSTAENQVNELINNGATDGVAMAGYGYGIPISRLYARYFGGDLQILCMEGYGECIHFFILVRT